MTKNFRAQLALLAALPLLSCKSPKPAAVVQQPTTAITRSSASPASCSAMSVGADGAFNGFVPDASDAWHQDVSAAPRAADSADFSRRKLDLNAAPLHPDFGSQFGIPYNVVDSDTTPFRFVTINQYVSESDVTAVPLPRSAVTEGTMPACSESGGDQHLILVDRKTCSAYEYFVASTCNGEWSAANVAMFDLQTPNRRPFGFTSADAAGLSILEGLVRYDEILSGHIDHALRFTARFTRRGQHGSLFVAPANHGAGQSLVTDNVMGMRIRLKADFDVSRYSKTNQIILNAMKRYGLILADNGANMFFQGTRDPRWDDQDLKQLTTVHATDFDVLEMGPASNTEEAPKGAPPRIVSFTASPAVSKAGMPVTLSADVQGASYSYIDQTGFLRGRSVVVRPTQTTHYKLTARNEYGSTSTEVVVEVR
ncbi:hypothetical protein SAMN05421819_1493 [Bryocella elongata]|uniref:Ig-like domain-containing protein n=1 Tax=Bryocella elongata TaxID=863522 RepID=A0A1H5WAI2_9BACT|nr:PKD domain-containing protein [Bryocella elongata]SEF96266.1 hypothetical protein SAMN05421819_1493 [Bryocella elongata]